MLSKKSGVMEHESFDMGDTSSSTPKFAITSLNQSMKCCIFIFVVVLSVCIAVTFIFILIESDVMTVNFPRALPSRKSSSGNADSQEQNLDEVLKLRLQSMQEYVDILKSNMTVLNSSSDNSSDIDFLRLKNTFQNEVNELNHRLNNFHPISHEVDIMLRDVQTQVLHLQLRINEATDRKIKSLEDGKKNLERELNTAQEKLLQEKHNHLLELSSAHEQLHQEKQNHLRKTEEVLAYKSMLRSSGPTSSTGNVFILVSTCIYSVSAVWLL